MAHLLKQMYSDEVANIKRQFTPRELTAVITIELIRRKMEEIKTQKGNPSYSTKKMVTDERCCWWNLSDHAKYHIDQEQTWKLILEAFQLLIRQDPRILCQRIFEQTFKLSYLGLHTIYSDIHKTITFENLMDYIICIDKLKYKSSV